MDVPHKDDRQEKKPLRGLYRNVNISVRALDIIIVVSILLIIVLVVTSLQNPGHTVTFDSKGGSDVVPQTQEYGELLKAPEPPVREGYTFTGWYKDHACMDPWDLQNDTIQMETTLYAGWEQNP